MLPLYQVADDSSARVQVVHQRLFQRQRLVADP
jgi:hypothetical protein